MKHNLVHNWNLMRAIRLGLGIFILIQSVMVKDWTLGILGIAFTLMPLLNIGCCGGGECRPASRQPQPDPSTPVQYEEVV